MVDGFQVNRKFSNYLISAETEKYINNNQDCWERDLLLQTFPTFIGGENYVEHIQIPELSKGKIIDAAARDIGESVYVDILVATEKRFHPLIQAITSGQLQTLSMGCFLPGTPVTLSDGRRIPIEDVQPGEMVLTHKGRAREVVNKQIRQGHWGMRRISVVGLPDSIGVTDTHEFYVLRAAKTCGCGCGEKLSSTDRDSVRRMTKRFKVGHDKRIFNPNGTYSLGEARRRRQKMEDLKALQVEKVRADELQVGDYVCLPKLVEAPIERESEGRARLLGYFLAEGSFLKHKGKPTEVQFNFSSDERDTFVQEVVDLLAAEFPEANPAWIQDRPERSTATVHATGHDMVQWFLQHGGEYSHRKRLSPEAMWWPVEVQRHILGAWINGDGNQHQAGHATGTTTSYDLVCQLQMLAIRCGIPVRMECRFGGKTATISEAVVGGEVRRHEVTGKLAHFNLCFPQSSSDCLTTVCDKAPVLGTRRKNQNLRNLDDMVIFPIKGIEPFEYEGWVHDLEVEEDHSYTVHGLAVSNCTVEYTQCTKCGNVAADESALCPHIRYFKGMPFVDANGIQRKIAELCGHKSDPKSVKFIEASWVANPAFLGAVLRNVLSPAQVPNVGDKVQIAFNTNRSIDPNALRKAASMVGQHHIDYLLNQLAGEQASVVIPRTFSPVNSFDFDDAADPETQEAKPESPMDSVVKELKDTLRERAVREVREEMNSEDADRVHDVRENQNDTLIKSAIKKSKQWKGIADYVLSASPTAQASRKILAGLILYKSGGWNAVAKTGNFTGRDILAISRTVDAMTKRASLAGEGRLYKAIVAVGGLTHGNQKEYLARCSQVIGRELKAEEVQILVFKGRLYALGS